MNASISPETLTARMAGFTATENYTKWSPIIRGLMTDGALYVAENAGAFWLFDNIAASVGFDPKVKGERFVVAKLVVADDRSATVTLEDGNDKVLTSEKVTYTDFPLPEFTVWAVYDEGMGAHVYMLPSEY